MKRNQLQISSWLPRSVAHGPGQRFVVWVQGCPLGCPGCFSSHTHDPRGGWRVPVRNLARTILATDGVEGITISGGEPLMQATALAVLAERVRRGGLTVMCYTGFTLRELRAQRRADINRFLQYVDILVDGRFEQAQAARLRWRGSRNQHVHFLSDAYRHLEDRADGTTHVELLIHETSFTTTGVWPDGFVEHVVKTLSGGRS